MRINNNIMAMNTHRQLGVATNAGAKSMEKLSSGFRINKASDDAAGLSISEKMRGQIRGLTQASRNAQDGISMVQTAEGALDEVHSMLQRVRELAVQSANDSNTGEDRTAIQAEVNQLLDEIDDVSTKTQFNGQTLLNGDFKDKVIHVGANGGQSIEITIDAMDTSDDGLKLSGLKEENLSLDDEGVPEGTNGILSQGNADSAIKTIDEAIKKVSAQRSELGAKQNRMEHTIKNVDNAAENLQAAESRIRDVDMAKEMMEQTKQNILQQASTSMLAQANMAPQTVLQLLG